MAKRAVLQPIQAGLVVSASSFSAAVKVYGMGPNTVSAQVNTTAFTSAVGSSAQLQASNDNISFFNVGSAVNITAVGTLAVADTAVAYAYYRLSLPITSGTYTVTIKWLVYGDTL